MITSAKPSSIDVAGAGDAEGRHALDDRPGLGGFEPRVGVEQRLRGDSLRAAAKQVRHALVREAARVHARRDDDVRKPVAIDVTGGVNAVANPLGEDAAEKRRVRVGNLAADDSARAAQEDVGRSVLILREGYGFPSWRADQDIVEAIGVHVAPRG